MPPRKRVNFNQQDVDAQLQSIHLLDASSVTENLEALGPIIKSINESRQQEAFLRTVNGLVESKETEIQKICGDNYLDFVSSVSTLLTVRSYTVNLKDRITSLDHSVTTVGHNLAVKKKELLQSKRTAANLDEAIDTLQGVLKILDLVKRVGDMIKEGRYWSALRSLEEIQTLPPSALSQTPLYTHLLSSLPSLRSQIKDAVTASNKTWLLEIRNVSEQIGKLALETMKSRSRRWRSRREKEPALKSSRVGSAVELVTNEKVEFNLLDNDQVKVDFKPLHQCIHIYTALSMLNILQTSYQADRKGQAALILSTISSNHLPTVLPSLTAELLGFFVVETEVLRTTVGFRSPREVEELWDEIIVGLVELVENGLRYEKNIEVFLEVKDILTGFVQTIEIYEFSVVRLHALAISMFEKYAKLLEQAFATKFDEAISSDDHQPYQVMTAPEREQVLTTCWMRPGAANALFRQPLPVVLPFSQMFYTCCTNIRQFVEKFYLFAEGASHFYRDIDELLRKTLDRLLTQHVSAKIASQLSQIHNFTQAAQVITNIEHFLVARGELEEQLTKLRASRRGTQIRLQSTDDDLNITLSKATDQLATLIKSKLDDFFELSEYDWTPPTTESSPNMYLYELVNWLMTIVDSLQLDGQYKDGAYKSALQHVATCLMDFIFGPNIPMVNENGVANLLVDVDFLESEFKKLGKSELTSVFEELRLTTSIAMNNTVSAYLQASTRQSTYQIVNPRTLYILLDKMAKFGQGSRVVAERQAADRRRKDADAVVRLFT